MSLYCNVVPLHLCVQVYKRTGEPDGGGREGRERGGGGGEEQKYSLRHATVTRYAPALQAIRGRGITPLPDVSVCFQKFSEGFLMTFIPEL